jgi:hypothetical protein
MSTSERSSYIFELAEEVGIPLEMGKEEVFEDERLLFFIEKYREWAISRDNALQSHLASKHNLFRCYLPYTPRVFGTVNEIIWYLDEVLVRDPIEKQIDISREKDFEKIKADLRITLQILAHFRYAIESGYLLLFGSSFIPPMGDTPEEIIKISNNPELVAELDHAVRFGMDRRMGSRGKEWIVWDAHLETGFLVGCHGRNIASKTQSPPIRIGEPLPEVSAEELMEALGQDPFEQIRDLYPREIHRSIRAVGIANRANSAVMFSRPVDAAIIASASQLPINQTKQGMTVGSFNLALPYLRGIPTDRLLDLRLQIPDAFIQFRAKMASIVKKASQDSPDVAIDELKLDVEREIGGSLRELETAMRATANKIKISTIGVPIITASGILIGSVANLGLQSLLPIAVGGTLGLVHALSSSISERTRLSGNPLWFLWRATK